MTLLTSVNRRFVASVVVVVACGSTVYLGFTHHHDSHPTITLANIAKRGGRPHPDLLFVKPKKSRIVVARGESIDCQVELKTSVSDAIPYSILAIFKERKLGDFNVRELQLIRRHESTLTIARRLKVPTRPGRYRLVLLVLYLPPDQSPGSPDDQTVTVSGPEVEVTLR